MVDTLGQPKNPKPNPLTAKFKDLTENMIALSKKISEETTKKAIGALSLTQIKNKIWTSGCETQKRNQGEIWYFCLKLVSAFRAHQCRGTSLCDDIGTPI